MFSVKTIYLVSFIAILFLVFNFVKTGYIFDYSTAINNPIIDNLELKIDIKGYKTHHDSFFVFLNKLQLDSQKISHLHTSGKSTKVLQKYVQKFKTITKKFRQIELFLQSGDKKVEKRSPWNVLEKTITLIYNGLEKNFTVASSKKIQQTQKVHSKKIDHSEKDLKKTKSKMEIIHTEIIKHIDENLHRFKTINSTLLRITKEIYLQALLHKIKRYTLEIDFYLSKVFSLIQGNIIPIDLLDTDHMRQVYNQFLINSKIKGLKLRTVHYMDIYKHPYSLFYDTISRNIIIKIHFLIENPLEELHIHKLISNIFEFKHGNRNFSRSIKQRAKYLILNSKKDHFRELTFSEFNHLCTIQNEATFCTLQHFYRSPKASCLWQLLLNKVENIMQVCKFDSTHENTLELAFDNQNNALILPSKKRTFLSLCNNLNRQY